jgi:hypothetical protein
MPDIVTFDPTNLRIIEIDSALDINTLSIREIYSEWKDWLLADGSRKGYPAAFGVVGGEPISDTENLGSTFFLLAPWKIRAAEYSHTLILEGNIFTVPAGESPIVTTLGAYTVNYTFKVSTLVESVSGGGSGGLTAQETADAVWQAAEADYTDPLTMGGKILADLAAILAAGGSLSPTQDLQLSEIWKILGLDPTNPLIVSKTLRTAGGAVQQDIEENVPAAGSVKITRQ